jgi:hypothetical protein
MNWNKGEHYFVQLLIEGILEVDEDGNVWRTSGGKGYNKNTEF